MNIWTPLVESMPPDLQAQLMEEIRNGWLRESVNAEINNRRMGYDNRRPHKAVDGIGRLRMRVDATSYHYWGQKLGYDCWRDERFLRDYERDVPASKVNCGGTRLQVGFTGNKRSSKRYEFSPSEPAVR